MIAPKSKNIQRKSNQNKKKYKIAKKKGPQEHNLHNIHNTYNLNTQNTQHDTIQDENILVEVLDNAGYPLLQMPLSLCKKQKLSRKLALGLVVTAQNQILLKNSYTPPKKKRKKTTLNETHKKIWDIPIYSNVYAEESYEDAIIREIAKQLDIVPNRLYELKKTVYEKDNTLFHAILYSTNKITFQDYMIQEKLNIESPNSEYMLLSPKELKAILAHSPELFSLNVLWLSELI